MQTNRDCGPVLLHNMMTNCSADLSLAYSRILSDCGFPNTNDFRDDMWDHPWNHAAAVETLKPDSSIKRSKLHSEAGSFGVLLRLNTWVFHWVMVLHISSGDQFVWHNGMAWCNPDSFPEDKVWYVYKICPKNERDVGFIWYIWAKIAGILSYLHRKLF